MDTPNSEKIMDSPKNSPQIEGGILENEKLPGREAMQIATYQTLQRFQMPPPKDSFDIWLDEFIAKSQAHEEDRQKDKRMDTREG